MLASSLSKPFGRALAVAALAAAALTLPAPPVTGQAANGTITGAAGGFFTPVCVSAVDHVTKQVVDEHFAAQGNFVLSVPAGTYFVWYIPCGPGSTVGAAVELFDGAYSYDTATPVEVFPGANHHIVRTTGSVAGASVRGVVTDSDGRPVAGCAVLVVTRTAIPTIVAADHTDGAGAYAAFNVPPGTMDVQAHCGRGFVPTYHSSTTDPALAEPIITTPGQRTWDVDLIAIRRVRSVAGTVSWETDAVKVCAYAVADNGTALRRAVVDPDGTWELVPLPVGEVRIGFFRCNAAGLGPAPEWYEDKPEADFASATRVPVSATSATTQIDATLRALGGLGFAFYAPDNGGPATSVEGVCVWVTDPSGTVLVRTAYAADGGVTLYDFAPGEYRALFTDCGGGFPVEWWEDAPDHATSTPILVTGGNFTSVIATLG